MDDNNLNNDSFSDAVAVGADIKKKKKPIALFIALGVLIIALAGFLTYTFIPAVKNTVRMTVMKPDKYYATIEKENAAKTAKDVNESYSKALDNFSKDTAQSYELGVKISDEIASQYGLEKIKDISLKGNSNYKNKEGLLSETAQILMNGDSILTINMISELQKLNVFYQIPELSESYLNVAGEVALQDAGDSLDIIKEIYNTDNWIEADKLEDMINTYSSVIVDNVSDVELEKGVDGDALGVDYKYNVLTADISQKDLCEIATAVLKEAKNDDEIYDLAKEVYGLYVIGKSSGVGEINTDELDLGSSSNFTNMALLDENSDDEQRADDEDDSLDIAPSNSEELTKEMYETYIDQAIDTVKSAKEEASNDTMFKLMTYVDAEGTIRGRELEAYEDGEKMDSDIKYIEVKDGDKAAVDISFIADGEGAKIEINADEKEKDTYTGTANIMAYDGEKEPSETLGVNFEDFKVVNDKYLNGKFSLDLSKLEGEDIPDIKDTVLEFSSDGDNQDMTLNVVVGGTDYGTLTLKAKEEKSGDDIKVPTDNVYSMDQIEGYLNEVDIDKFISDLDAKLGFKIEDVIGNYTNAGIDDYDVNGDYDIDDYDYTIPSDSSSSSASSSSSSSSTASSSASSSSVSNDDYSYDFSKLKVNVNGKDVKLPCVIAGVEKLVDTTDIKTIEPGDWQTAYSADGNFDICFSNTTDKAQTPATCPIESFDLYGKISGFDVNVNGVKIDSSVADIEKAFGIKVKDANSYIKIANKDDEFQDVTFYMFDGKVTSMSVDIMQ